MNKHQKLIAFGLVANTIGTFLLFAHAPSLLMGMSFGLGTTLIIGGWIRLKQTLR